MQAARELGVRIVAARGSMDLGESKGGLPPDHVVETTDGALWRRPRRLRACTRAGAGARVQIVVAPCSPFSVTKELMRESAELARRLGLRLHTHLAETVEEDAYCLELYGCRPVEYLEQVGWLAEEAWCAHCVHLSDADVAAFAAADVGVAHCPTSNLRLGAGVAPVRGARRRPRARRASASTARPRTSAATCSSRSSRRCSSRAAAAGRRR